MRLRLKNLYILYKENRVFKNRPGLPNRLLGFHEHGKTYINFAPVNTPSIFAVVIYDGRTGSRHKDRGFHFTDEDFLTLRTWPVLTMQELPDDTAVAIGYTVNTYKTQGANAGIKYTNLSTNIQFVILLSEYEETSTK